MLLIHFNVKYSNKYSWLIGQMNWFVSEAFGGVLSWTSTVSKQRPRLWCRGVPWRPPRTSADLWLYADPVWILWAGAP